MVNNVLSLLVKNHHGVLARISGLLSGRGYNVESFSVGVTTDPGLSRMTLICHGNDVFIEQVKKQLNKIIDVIKVVDLTNRSTVDRELALIKVAVNRGERGELFQIAGVFGATIKAVDNNSAIMEVTGEPSKIDDIVNLLGPSILEMARSGLVSLEKGR